mmetsp:Transcript_15473/g.39776  ORF Transcript_15473/g.39776 Transcript_15473/m.39776 type:complete len:306 (-) Transcript_15473:175-1092(-)|eukprot:jgi/Tetstr1/436698/TSEL_002726.t1
MKLDRSDSWWVHFLQKSPSLSTCFSPREKRTHGSVHSRYKLCEAIGEGAHSTVRVAVDRNSGQEWACKVITEEAERDCAQQQIRALKRLYHPNLLVYREHFADRDALHIITELLRGPDLLTDLLKRGRYTEDETCLVAAQLLSALAHLHDGCIVHGDVKLENVVLARNDGSLDLRLVDLGFAEDIGKPLLAHDTCGTPLYAAPELLTCKPAQTVDGGRDIWAAGVLCYALLSGRYPFFGRSLEDLYDEIVHAEPDFDNPHIWGSLSQAAKSVVKGMLTRDALKRPSAKQLLSYPWFRGSRFMGSA